MEKSGSPVCFITPRLRRTLNRLFQGSSILTVFHEEGHGFHREARTTGRLTRADDIAFVRAANTVLAGRLTREGKPLQLLPHGIADADITEDGSGQDHPMR